MAPDDNREQYNLAPSATPCAMYGLLGVLLCWIPLLGMLLSVLGLMRARVARRELAAEGRYQGQRLVSIGIWLSIVGVALGLASGAAWILVMV